MNKNLFQLEPVLKKLLTSYLLVLLVGVSLGLVYVSNTTSLTPDGTVSRFNGDEEIDFNSVEAINYEKSFSEVLMTTHNHILGFSFIFLSLGFIFYFNSIVERKIKVFFMIEPFISIILSFGSIWGIRFIDSGFVYVTIVSATLLYLSFFIMVGVSLYELVLKGKNTKNVIV